MSKLLSLIYPLTLLALFSLLFLFNLGHPVIFDFNESTFAEVSREMYNDSQLILPTLNGEPFFEMQPLLYWAQMWGYKLFGISAFSARILNAICAIATLLILFFGSKSPLGNRSAFNGSLILGSSILFVSLSRIATPDMFFTMLLVFCLVVSWHAIEHAVGDTGGTVLLLLSCLASALAILSKGTIGLLLPLGTALLYLLSIRRVSFLFKKKVLLPGAAVVLFFGYSWYLLVAVLHPAGFGFAKKLLIEHNYVLFFQPAESYSERIFYGLMILLIGFVPWISYLPLAAFHVPVWKNDSASSRFLRYVSFFSALVILLFFFTGSKSPNNLLLLLPGIALITATLFNREEIKYPFFWRLSGWFSAILFCLLGAVFAAAPLFVPYLPDLLGEHALKAPVLAEPISLGYVPWLAAALFISCGIFIIRATRTYTISKIFESLLLSSFVASATLFLAVVPLYDHLMNRPLVRLAQLAAEHTPPGEKIIGYEIGSRPSVMFSAGRQVIYDDTGECTKLSSLFSRPDVSVGITTNYYYSRLLNCSLPVTELSRDGGFILFKVNQPASSAP